MREQLIQYINGLFAGSTGAEEIQQEILQDTLDKYDDLIAQGASSEEAYHEAVESIGDVQALLDELTSQADSKEEDKREGGTSKWEKAIDEWGESVDEWGKSMDEWGKDVDSRINNAASWVSSAVNNAIKIFRSKSGHTVRIIVGKNEKDESNTKEYSPEEVESLEIDWISGEVTIAAAQQETITVREEFSSGDEPMVVQLNGGKLSVKYSEKSSKLISKDKDLFIIVPAIWIGKRLKFNTTSANLECTDLTFAEAQIHTTSGDCSFQEGRMETVNVGTISGDISYHGKLKSLSVNATSGDLDFNGSLETLHLNTTSGDAEVVLDNKPRELSINLVSGDLDLTLPDDCGFSMKSSTVSGEFDSEFHTAREGRYRVYGDGACEINANSVSGDISIHKGSSAE